MHIFDVYAIKIPANSGKNMFYNIKNETCQPPTHRSRCRLFAVNVNKDNKLIGQISTKNSILPIGQQKQ